VLVVGDGATGRQIAAELVVTHAVALATGKPWQVVPQRVLGKDTLWWFDRLGALRADKDTRYGRWVRAHDAIPGWHLRRSSLRRLGVQLVPRTVGATGHQLQFADGTSDTFEVVIWALGYRDEASWLQMPAAVDTQGRCVEDCGISPVPRLFYVGRSWQTTRASALLYGVGADAAPASMTRGCRWMFAIGAQQGRLAAWVTVSPGLFLRKTATEHAGEVPNR